MFQLTHKQLLELKFWLTADMKAEQMQLARYSQLFAIDLPSNAYVLEIGTGPHWGLLPKLDAHIKYGVDPLYPAYYAAGILHERNDILQVDECFEHWDTDQTFDVIITTNALDHGEMGFYLLPKIWRMLKPGGRFYLHVNLRPTDLLNLIHDHSLTEEQLNRHLAFTDLIEERRELYDRDFDGFESRTLTGVWRKP